jgi:hypothetical protein
LSLHPTKVLKFFRKVFVDDLRRANSRVQELLLDDAQRMLNIDPRQLVVAFAQAVAGGVDRGVRRCPLSLYFPVNNRKKQEAGYNPAPMLSPQAAG